MSKYTVCAHTAYPFFSDEKPEVYNGGIPQEVRASNAREAARLVTEQTRREWEKYGSPGETGTFRYAVIGWDNYSYGPTVEIVDVTVKPKTVCVSDVETVYDQV